MIQYPKRSDSHIVGDLAVKMFANLCPSDWVITPQNPDYGIDLRIEPSSNGVLKGEEFGVQIKGRTNTSVKKDGNVSLFIKSSTVNYWLGKLNPTMIVLADTEKKQLWFNWLEYAYSNYPSLINSDSSIEINLIHKIGGEFSEQVKKYINSYFSRLREDLKDIYQDVQLSRLLLHVSALSRTLTRIHLTLTSNQKEKDVSDYINFLLLEYGIHDDFLMNLWKDDPQLCLRASSRITLILESKFEKYINLRNHFWNREKKLSSGDFHFIPFSYKALTQYLLSTLESLWDIDELLNELIVLK